MNRIKPYQQFISIPSDEDDFNSPGYGDRW